MSSNIKIISWNLLAHEFTHYNYQSDEHGQPNCKETIEQTICRYNIIINEIIKQDSDVYLLQEVSEQFLNKYSENSKLHDIYYIYTTFGIDMSPGTSILIKKSSSFLNICYFDKIEACQLNGNKTSTVVSFDILDQKIILVSIHTVSMRNNGIEVRLYHLSQLSNILNKLIDNKNMSVIIGGDFNCHKPSEYYIDLIDNTILKKFNSIDYGSLLTCKMHERVSCIDHIFYYGKSIKFIEKYSEKSYPFSPYGIIDIEISPYAPIECGSDHSWISGLFEI
jgi:endonuclease/exonuclease/phosphatase (EEP) superfamily protein YafD